MECVVREKVLDGRERGRRRPKGAVVLPILAFGGAALVAMPWISPIRCGAISFFRCTGCVGLSDSVHTGE